MKVLVIIGLLFLAYYFGIFNGLFALFSDGYNEYDDGFLSLAGWDSSSSNPTSSECTTTFLTEPCNPCTIYTCSNSKWKWNGDSKNRLYVDNTKVSYSAREGNWQHFRTNTNMKNMYNYKTTKLVDFKINYIAGGAYYNALYLNGLNIYSEEKINPPSPGSYVNLEIISSLQQPNTFFIYNNGQLYNTVTVPEMPLEFTLGIGGRDDGSGGEQSGSLSLTRFAYKPRECTLDSDEVLFYDDFAQGSVITQSNLAYPVQRYCWDIPSLVFTDSGIITDTQGEYFNQLITNNPINVNTRAFRVFYITKYINTPVNTPCPKGQAYSSKTNQCTNYLINPEFQVCNNNLIEGNEQCDTTKLNGQSCVSLGYISGTLSCTSTCTFNKANCVLENPPSCGDGTVNTGEECEPGVFVGSTCKSEGFDTGSLTCLNCQIDTSLCAKNTTVTNTTSSGTTITTNQNLTITNEGGTTTITATPSTTTEQPTTPITTDNTWLYIGLIIIATIGIISYLKKKK